MGMLEKAVFFAEFESVNINGKSGLFSTLNYFVIYIHSVRGLNIQDGELIWQNIRFIIIGQAIFMCRVVFMWLKPVLH